MFSKSSTPCNQSPPVHLMYLAGIYLSLWAVPRPVSLMSRLSELPYNSCSSHDSIRSGHNVRLNMNFQRHDSMAFQLWPYLLITIAFCLLFKSTTFILKFKEMLEQYSHSQYRRKRKPGHSGLFPSSLNSVFVYILYTRSR